MRCLTIVDDRIYQGITLVTNQKTDRLGVGIDGTIAEVGDGLVFPKPELSVAGEDCFVPNLDREYSVVYIADVFLMKHNQMWMHPLLHAETHPDTSDLLLFWAAFYSGKYNPTEIKAQGKSPKTYMDTSRGTSGYWQSLISVTMGTTLIGKCLSCDLIISWDGRDLNLNRKSK